MHQKRFLLHEVKKSEKHHQIASIIGNCILLLGAVLIVSSLFYLLYNLDKSDSLFILMMPIIILGVVLMIVSQFILPERSRLRHRIKSGWKK
jgi:hypothetical protein